MINNFKNSLKSNKTIIGNIFSLGFLQIFSYIIPLITLPYILRVLGPEKFGIIAFAGAFVGYFMIIVNYGFNLTTTKDISIHRENNTKISEIFWNVIFIKIFLALGSFIVSSVIIFSFQMFSKEYIVFLFSFLMILGEVFFPIWMFQGMEKMKYITIINVIIKSIFLIPIVLFIHTTNDYIFLPLITSLSYICTGVIAFIMSIKIFKLRFILPTFNSIKYHLGEGWHVFISTIFISFYTTSTTFILGLCTNNTTVGYYASAEKLVKAFQGLIGPISQAIYPNISQKLVNSKEKTIDFLKKVTTMISIFTLFISLVLFFGAELIVNILFGKDFLESIIIVRILAFLPFIVGFSNIFLVLYMLNFGHKKQVSKIIMFFSVFSILMSIPMTIYYGGIGMSISILLTESLISITGFIYVKNKLLS